MAKKNYEQMAKDILEYVGGTENISHFAHCATRLRFNVKDKGVVDTKKIESISGILGTQWTGEQLQVIVGEDVETAYRFICGISGIKMEKAIDENLDSKPFKWSVKNVLNAIVDGVAGSIYPMLPVLIGGGMIKTVLLLCGPLVLNILSKESVMYTMLNFLGDTAFYFMPVIFAASAAKKFNASQGLAMLLGAALIHPTFINLVAAGTELNIFGIPVTNINYKSTVLPSIMIVYVMSHVEKLLKKYIPDFLKTIFVPLLTLLIMFPLAFCVLGPLGYIIGEFIAKALITINDATGGFGVALVAALWLMLVITGTHLSLVPVITILLSSQGCDPLIIVANIAANLSVAFASFGVGLKTKNTETKSLAITSAITAFLGGVTEPALFGICLKFKKPLICACTGAAVGALIAKFLNVACYTMIGTAGVFAIPSFAGPANNILYTIISFAIGCAVSSIGSFITHKD